MPYSNIFNTYDWIEAWRMAFRLPSKQWGAVARALDDRFVLPPLLAALEAFGMGAPLMELRRGTSAGLKLMSRLAEPHEKPQFGIERVMVDGDESLVTETVETESDFCRLLRFRIEGRSDAPRVLLVAPMAGHYATLLRETVRGLLPSYDVWITDWANARDVPMSHGGFDLDDYIDQLISFLTELSGVHVVAVCQAGVPSLAALALMEADPSCKDCLPASLTMMGSPIDIGQSPTEVNSLATSKDDDWFADTMITVVPDDFPGAHRAVYPGYMQLTAFVAMNPARHAKSVHDALHHFADGDFESAEKIDSFYGEFLSTMDLTAEFYLQTVEKIFRDNQLAKGEFVARGRKVDLRQIHQTPLLAVEGEKDDITGLGQTRAALDLATELDSGAKHYFMLEDSGHYGLFSGSRFRDQVVPEIMRFHAAT